MIHLNGLKAEIDKALQEMGMCNVLIAGRTGVGKSTLINSIFHGRMATTGQGRPVTRAARFISKEGVPLGLWDTRGLEMADFHETLDELTKLVERRAADPDPKRHIHVAWPCVNEDARRVQEAERICAARWTSICPCSGSSPRHVVMKDFVPKSRSFCPTPGTLCA